MSRGALCAAALALVVCLGGDAARAAASSPGTAGAAALPQDLAAAVAQLESRDPRERRKAVQSLAAVKTYQAYVVMLTQALTDREPMVADEAQLLLGRTHEPSLAALCFAKYGLGHRDRLVRLRTAELLGRMGAPVDAATWRAALKESDDEVARALYESLESHVAAGRVQGDTEELAKALAKAARRGGDPLARGAALLALTRLDAGAARPVAAELERAKEAPLRVAGLAARLAAEPEAAVVHAAAHVDDQATSVRLAAIEALVAAGTKPALRELAARLQHEQRVRVRAALVAGLRACSGLRHGTDPRPWLEWVEALPESHARSGDGRTDAPDADEDRTTTFLGHAVRSDRVTFLIDMSGSMWEEALGSTRKARVEAELRRALEALPESASFNVVPYADSPAPFAKALLPATKENVARALEAFERLTMRGKGAAWEALRAALADPEVDTLVLLSDGAPSGGERWNVELMGELLRRDLRLRRVTLDVVLFGARGGLVREWAKVTAVTGGSLREVDL